MQENPLTTLARSLIGDGASGALLEMAYPDVAEGGTRRQVTIRGIPHGPLSTFSVPIRVLAERVKPTCKSCGHAESKHDGGMACSAEGCDCAGFRAAGDSDVEPDPEDPNEPNETGPEEMGTASIGSVQGVASSTSRDWYGTDMSVEALNGMRDQFLAGVPLLPTHGSWLSTPEWDDVIGMSIDAVVEPGPVADAVDGEAGQLLTVTSSLYDVPKARELQMRLDKRQPIGQSIGGWFTALTVIYDEETGDVHRVTILAVELDHLAVTRMPANPDCNGLANLRSRAQAAARSLRRAPEQRSVPAPASNPASVTPAPDPDASLDARGVASEDDTVNAPGIAAGEPQETDMPVFTPEQTAELNRAVAAAVAGALPTIVEAMRATPAAEPAPKPAAQPTERSKTTDDDDELTRLRAEVTGLRASVARITDSAARRGLHGATGPSGAIPEIKGGPGCSDGLRSLVAECRSQQRGVALAAVVERHVDVLAEEDGPAPVASTGSRVQLGRILRAGLHAAMTEGLIREPAAASWA